MKKRMNVFVFLAAIIASAMVPAAEYFVATNGVDASGGGTEAAPFRTINYAISAASANGAIRYELPSNAQVRIEDRSGSWRRHMGSMPDQRATGRVFEITIPHGVKPSAASCAWRVRPCASRAP